MKSSKSSNKISFSIFCCFHFFNGRFRVFRLDVKRSAQLPWPVRSHSMTFRAVGTFGPSSPVRCLYLSLSRCWTPPATRPAAATLCAGSAQVPLTIGPIDFYIARSGAFILGLSCSRRHPLRNSPPPWLSNNLIFRDRFMPVAASAGGIRFTRNISISPRNILCRPCPHCGLNANRKY